MNTVDRCSKLVSDLEKYRKLGMAEKVLKAEGITIEAISILSQSVAETAELRRRVESLEKSLDE